MHFKTIIQMNANYILGKCRGGDSEKASVLVGPKEGALCALRWLWT
jgi:hypothetical protein